MTRRKVELERGILITWLRALRGWEKAELAAVAKLDGSRLSRYELGKVRPTVKTLRCIAGAVGISWEICELLLGLIRRLLAQLTAQAGGASSANDSIFFFQRFETLLQPLAATILEGALGERPRSLPPLLEEEAGERADALWERLASLPHEVWRPVVEMGPEYHIPAFCRRLCAKSEELAAGDAIHATVLAGLAVTVAERAPASASERAGLAAWAWAAVGNARRVAGDLTPGADQAFARSKKERDAAGLPPGEEAFLLDLEASLRRDQRRFPEALELHAHALAASDTGDSPALLLNQAFTWEQQGEAEKALAILREASDQVDAAHKPRLRCVLLFNQVVNLCHLERFTEAEELLGEVHQLTERLDLGLDRIRLRWLDAKVSAGQGRTGEAITLLEEVRQSFRERDIPYDFALASLELAVLSLAQGDTARVRRLAAEMQPIFVTQKIHREALANLRLFCQAAERDVLSGEAARRYLTAFCHGEKAK